MSALQSWESRYETARRYLVPWIGRRVPLAGATVLEYGCGQGAVACALGRVVGRHIGVDIDGPAVAAGNEHVRERGLANVELEHHGLDTIMQRVAELEGELDVVLLYAVLEHMTVDERIELLRMARRIVRPTGHIVVCETPNRLHAWDHHSTFLPFFTILPMELQARYWDRSPRPDFVKAMAAASEEGPAALHEALVRWGRGVSFHEFEVAFGDLSRHVVASGFDVELFPERNLHPEELTLARFLAEHYPELAPGWARYWLDLILTPEPLDSPSPPQMRPWSMEPGFDSVGCRWTRWESIAMSGPQARLRVSLPAAASRLGCSFAVSAPRGTVSIAGIWSRTTGIPKTSTATAPRGEPSHHELVFDPPASEFVISLDRPGFVTFVGWTPVA
jgi:SAM-dependent methyltransferase